MLRTRCCWLIVIVALSLVLDLRLLPAQRCLEPDFRVDLLAAVPEIEHPSVVTCDNAGSLFVGEDPMDMRGPTTKEFDRVLRITFDENGAIQQKTVFCDQLSAVFGLIWHDDALYVMHAPHYTRFRDLDHDGVADERTELADGFGPAAGIYGFNDHIVTGTRLGLDGRVYISIGDKGVPLATGSDGTQVTLEGGGVIRMTLDGGELEVFSSGTRNHLDVAMDSLDRIFTYDNTDDGLGWWTRFTHHVQTGYYGYPFDYHPHPERHLSAISEHGGGSPVGAACYRGAVWPERFREAAFHCEWGKGKVQLFRLTQQGATFTAEMSDFLVPEEGSDFRPQDVCFSPDGRHMYVADWNFGGWVQDKQLGRLYRVTYVGPEQPAAVSTGLSAAELAEADVDAAVRALSDSNYDVRRAAQDRLSRDLNNLPQLNFEVNRPDGTPHAAVHALWAAASLAESDESRQGVEVIKRAAAHVDPRVRAQAARALGSILAQKVPAVVSVTEHEYREREITELTVTTPRALSGVPEILLGMCDDLDPEVRMQAVIALGRISPKISLTRLALRLDDSDPTVRFATRRALRSIGNWNELQNIGTQSAASTSRELVLAATGVFDPAAVDLLAAISQLHPEVSVRAAALQSLSEVYQRADRYEQGWWGTRPAAGEPARQPKYEWEGSPIVIKAIRDALQSPSVELQVAALLAFRTIDDAESLPAIRAALASDDKGVRRAAIEVVSVKRDAESIEALALIVDDANAAELRDSAIVAMRAIGGEQAARQLTGIVGREEASAEAMVAAIDALTEMQHAPARSVIARRTHHVSPKVRAAALRGLTLLDPENAVERLLIALEDEQSEPRIAALRGLARLEQRDAIGKMLPLWNDPATRTEAGLALATLADPAALSVYLDALVDRNPELRSAASVALLQIKSQIGNDLKARTASNELSADVRRELSGLFSRPEPIRRWKLLGSWSKEQEFPAIDLMSEPEADAVVQVGDQALRWQVIETDDAQGKFEPGSRVEQSSNVWVVAVATLERDRPGKARWILGSDDQAIVSVNGQVIYEYMSDRGWSADQGSGEVDLVAGKNVIAFRSGNSSGPWQFSMAIGGVDPEFAFLDADVAPGLDLTAFRDHALTQNGNAERGAELFYAPEGIGCAKCHAVGDRGMANIGPNLLGVGAKYPKDELIRSVLEPSNRIFSGYEMTVIETDSGETLQGVVRSENEVEVVLGDARGELVRVPIEAILARELSTQSAMPNGLEKGMSLEDFADLIAYLESLKEDQPADTEK